MWTRRQTFPDAANDYIVLRDGLIVGRVMLDEKQGINWSRTVWLWSTVTRPAQQGYADTLEAALEAVREHATDQGAYSPDLLG